MRIALFAILFLASSCAALGDESAPTSAPKPILRYDFENVDGPRIPDVSGNGRDGKIIGESARIDSGSRGLGLKLNADETSGAYVEIPDDALDGVEDCTIVAWIKPSEYVNYARVFDFGLDEKSNFFLTPSTTEGDMRLAITRSSTAGETRAAAPTEVKNDVWTHLAAVKCGDALELYVNGRLAATSPKGAPTIKETLGAKSRNYIGKSQYAHDKEFRGAIDEFAIYDVAFDQRAILEILVATADECQPITRRVNLIPLGETPLLPDRTLVQFGDDFPIEIGVIWKVPDDLSERTRDYSVFGYCGSKRDAVYTVGVWGGALIHYGYYFGIVRYNPARPNRLFYEIRACSRIDDPLDASVVVRARFENASDSQGEWREIDRATLAVPAEGILRLPKTIELDPALGLPSEVEFSVAESPDKELKVFNYYKLRKIKSGSFLPDEDVDLLAGPFKQMRDDNEVNLLQMDIDRLCAAHFIAAGLTPKAERYGGWESADSCGFGIGHWLSAACLMYRKTGNDEYLRKIKYAVSELAQTRRPSGFIGGLDEKRVIANIFDRPNDFAVTPYNLGGIWDCWYGVQKVYKGLVEAYLTTGDATALDLAKGFADWSLAQTDKFNYPQTQRMLFCEHGAMSETSLWLYEITCDPHYLTLAERFLRDEFLTPLSKGVDNLTGRHVNEHIPEVQNAATYYETTGADKYRRAAEFFWRTCRDHRMYANSGMGLAEHYPPIDKEPLGSSNTETCCNFNMMKLTETLYSWDRRREYIDYLEESLFNMIYPSQDQDNRDGYGKTYFASFTPGSYRFFSTRDDSFWCCCLGGMENPARLDKAIYYKDGDAFYWNLFIPSRATWREKGLTFEQETRFPYENVARLRVTSGAASGSIKVRAPGWLAGDPIVKLNGDALTVSVEDGYVSIDREWRDGDELEIDLPTSLNVYRSREPGWIAFKYGPILLAAELDRVDDAERYTTNNNKLGGFKGVPIPTLKFDVDAPAEVVKPLDASKLVFKLDASATSDGSSFTLKPFFELNRNRYVVYWPTF